MKFHRVSTFFIISLGVFLLSAVLVSAAIHGNPSSFGGFTQSGYMRVYFDGPPNVTLSLKVNGQERWFYTDGNYTYMDTDLWMTSGERVDEIWVFDSGGDASGWQDMSGDYRCNYGQGHSGATINVKPFYDWVASFGEPIASAQCWSDSPPGDTDFNDYQFFFSYVPEGGGEEVPEVLLNINYQDTEVYLSAPADYFLTWDVPNGDPTCVASSNHNDWRGSKPDIGSQDFYAKPAGTYSYTLTCTNSAGSGSDTVYAYVSGSVPTVDIKANGSDGPITLSAPADYNLTWTSSGADSCSASGAWSGGKPINGSSAINDQSQGSYLYTLTCINPAGSGADSVRVNVNQALPVPVVDIKANGSDGPLALTEPADYTLTWTSSDADSCTASGSWSGAKVRNGSQAFTAQPAGNYTYTLSCSNATGTGSDSVTVNVNLVFPPVDITSFRITNFVQRTDTSGNPFYVILAPQMRAGFHANISWSATNAVSCLASCTYKNRSGEVIAENCEWLGPVSPSGSQQVQPQTPGSVDYNLQCTGQGGDQVTRTFIAAIKEFFWEEINPGTSGLFRNPLGFLDMANVMRGALGLVAR